MTAREVAEYLRWPMLNKQGILRRLKQMRDDGLIVGFRDSNREWMYRYEDVLAYLKGL